jgi:hypothetical protein
MCALISVFQQSIDFMFCWRDGLAAMGCAIFAALYMLYYNIHGASCNAETS